MLTIRRATLLGLLVLSVGLVACTTPGRMAREHRDDAHMAMAERAGMTVERRPAGGAAAPAAPAGGAAAGAGASSDPAKLGQQVATANGCVACHSVDGKAGVGPSWKGLFDSNRELVSGGPVKADEAYIRESIATPNAKIAKGFQPNLMPATFGAPLKPEQIDQLLAYIKSVK